MADPVRLRQICLLARDLEWTSSVLSAAFDAPVVFRDPRMAAGGSLTNTHIRLGRLVPRDGLADRPRLGALHDPNQAARAPR